MLCGRAMGGRLAAVSAPAVTAPPGPAPAKDMVWVPGGTFLMGSEDFYPEERPVRPATVDGFWIDEHPVTVAAFRRFVKATGHVTVAEHAPEPADYPDADPDLLVPGSGVFRMPPGPVPMDDVMHWWAWVPGASWRHPEGPGSTLDGRDRHPVTHVAFADAVAYAGVGREGPAHRGGVGAGRPGWAGGRGLHLGRRGHTQGPAHGQHMAGAVPVGEPVRGRLRRHLAGAQLPAQRLRAVRHGRERLGVDRGRGGVAAGRRAHPRRARLRVADQSVDRRPARARRRRVRPASSSRAAPTSARRATAFATAPRPASSRPRTRRPATSASGASSVRAPPERPRRARSRRRRPRPPTIAGVRATIQGGT